MEECHWSYGVITVHIFSWDKLVTKQLFITTMPPCTFFLSLSKSGCILIYAWEVICLANASSVCMHCTSIQGNTTRLHSSRLYKWLSHFFFLLLLYPAFQKLPSSSPKLMRILEQLTLLTPGDLIPYSESLTASMALLLEPAVPRRTLQTLNKLWMGLNTVMPRRYNVWIQLNIGDQMLERKCCNDPLMPK